MEAEEIPEFQYSGRKTAVAVLAAFGALGVGIAFAAASGSFWLAGIGGGIGFLAVVAYVSQIVTHRLRLEPDALVKVSCFGGKRIPYGDFRAVRYWHSDDDSRESFQTTFVSTGEDVRLADYGNEREIIDLILQRCGPLKVHDERKFPVP